MFDVVRTWFRRHFSDPQAVLLAVLLLVGFTIVIWLGRVLAPVLAAVVIAYLLEGLVQQLERSGLRRLWVVSLVFLVFMVFATFLLLGVVPLMWTQLKQLVTDLPNYIAEGQRALLALPEHYAFITEEQIREVILVVRAEMGEFGQHILAFSLASIPGIITVLVYVILVPLLVFFFLKDKDRILGWMASFMPRDRSLTSRVWAEVDQQLGNYVRGKFWEILIVGGVSFIFFAVLGLKYSLLLAVIVGLSVIVPYIGATVVTVPIAVVGYFQWGWGSEFAYLMIGYLIIQTLDGNVLVPLLFSEVVDLHPIAIIVSVLVFGSLWGFWGLFFAIPLATLFNVLLNAWPRTPQATPGGDPDAATPHLGTETKSGETVSG